MRNVFTIDADIKRKNIMNAPLVTQNDAVSFIVNVYDDGQPFSLDSVETVSLASVRLDRQTVVTPGIKTGTNTVQFDLGTEETRVPGKVEAIVQLYDSEGRVSTISFTYQVLKDPTGDGYIPSEREQTLIETVLGDGPLVIQQAQDAAEYATAQGDYAKQVADENKTRWLTAVNTYADIATTYPNPQLGDTVQTIDDSKIYRWDGSQWVWTQQYSANALTDVQNKIGILKTFAVNVKEFGAKGDGVTDDTAAIQSAINSMANSSTRGILFFPQGTYIISDTLTILEKVTIEGAGNRSTVFKLISPKSLFRTINAGIGRTQQFHLKNFKVETNVSLTEPTLDLRGGSYFTVENVEINGSPDGGNTKSATSGILFTRDGASFNGYARLKNVRVTYFQYGAYGEVNDIHIESGLYNQNTEYGIYLPNSNVVSIVGAECSNNNKGGIFAEGTGINISSCWFEYNGNRISSLYSKNNVEIGSSSEYVFVDSCRWDISNAGIIHGDKEDYGIHFGSGIGNAHNSSYGLISNGLFDFLDSTGKPLGWNVVGSLAFESIPDPENTPQGHGNGIRLRVVSGVPKFYQRIFSSNNEIKKYKGRKLIAHMYVRANGSFSSSHARCGITIDPLTLGGMTSGAYITASIEPGRWIKYTSIYTIQGTENQISVAFEISGDGNTLDIVGVTAHMGELNFGNHEKVVTSAGGEIWSQEFKIGGKRHGWGTAAPTTGTWNQGDIVYNITPSAGGYIGWVCVSGGTPGTWKGFGLIQS